jgi:L-threonylcarbamoyladenylate synthase
LPRSSPIKGTKEPARAAVFGLADGIAALKAGQLVVYPTETFYALGADAFSSTALRRLFQVKRRELGRPVGLIAADTAMAFSLAREIPFDARRLARAFWPGPLTIVLPARADLAPELTGPGGVGVRVSPNPVARALSAAIGRPITATSANLSGKAPPTTLEAARTGLGEKVKVYLEGGNLAASAPSTVVAVNPSGWKMVRMGAISEDQIAAAMAGDALK